MAPAPTRRHQVDDLGVDPPVTDARVERQLHVVRLELVVDQVLEHEQRPPRLGDDAVEPRVELAVVLRLDAVGVVLVVDQARVELPARGLALEVAAGAHAEDVVVALAAVDAELEAGGPRIFAEPVVGVIPIRRRRDRLDERFVAATRRAGPSRPAAAAATRTRPSPAALRRSGATSAGRRRGGANAGVLQRRRHRRRRHSGGRRAACPRAPRSTAAHAAIQRRARPASSSTSARGARADAERRAGSVQIRRRYTSCRSGRIKRDLSHRLCRWTHRERRSRRRSVHRQSRRLHVLAGAKKRGLASPLEASPRHSRCHINEVDSLRAASYRRSRTPARHSRNRSRLTGASQPQPAGAAPQPRRNRSSPAPALPWRPSCRPEPRPASRPAPARTPCRSGSSLQARSRSVVTV